MDLQLHLLNPQQRQAVEHLGGPLLILAGAGSGKTRVIIHRIGYLLQQGISPGHILAVSFTNKAAQEMQERVGHLVGPGASEIYLSTFHSLGADILRQDIDVIGYKKPFTILDQGDQLAVVKSAMAELQLDPKMVDPRNVLALISRAKMAFSDPQDVEDMRTNPLMPFAQRIFHRYQSALRGLNAVDFDDLICLPVRVFKASEETRLKWSKRFHFVMVDEYQDTNHTQLLFLDELVRDHQNIVVVGDDDQSIYGFRGAVAENILEFEHQFNSCKVIKLEQNYRSTNTILKAANELIANNSVRKEKALWSANGDGEPILYVECANEREEAEFVAAEIERLKLNLGLEYDDFAILYRVNPQARLFEEALRGFRIPYTLVGGTEFFDRKEVKDFLGYLKAALNPNDEINVRRIVNVPPRGIGPTLLERISDLAHERGWGFSDTLEQVAADPELVHGIGPSSASHLSELVRMLKTYRARFREAEKQGDSLTEVGRAFLKSTKLIEHVRNVEKNPKMARRRVDNVEDLLGSIATFEEREGGTLEGYLNRIALDRSYDNKDKDPDRGVKMMTLHSSKGLEFKVVFFVGLEEGYMPHERSKDSEDGVAEERRLAYVGLTRAKEVLYLTAAAERTRFGQKDEREPSRFLDEIPLKLIRTVSASGSSSLTVKREDQEKRYLAALRSAIFDD